MKRLVLSVVLAVGVSAPAWSESLTYHQVLQRAVERDASLRIAGMQVERARQELDRVESQLGWVLGGQGGVAREVNSLGAPVDRADANASVERRLESGSTVGVGAGAAREESDTVLSPLQPNPSQSTRVDLNYRLPLARGSDNATYHEGLASATAGVDVAHADWQAARNQLARRAAELHFSAALTRVRLRNVEEAIVRAERFQDYIARNFRLGVAEEKDRLQAEAQLRARLAERRSLEVAWENQRTALNRLMERRWDDEWQPVVAEPAAALPAGRDELETQALEHSADMRRERARLRTAEAALARARDAGRDQADLVFSVGNRTVDGDIPAGTSLSESERVGSLRFEYRAALDRRGTDAEVRQAYLDRSMSQQRLEQTRTELHYSVAGLASEIVTAAAALEQLRGRQVAERAKLDDAVRRYRQGRIDTAQVIQFENDYEAATLALDQQLIELARKRAELDLLRGALWLGIELPAASEIKP